MAYTPIPAYKEGDVAATPSGIVTMWKDVGGVIVPVSATKPLPVSIIAGGGGAVTIADGADVAEGATTDAAVTTNAAGTVSGKLRGLVAILANVWDSVNSRLNTAITAALPAGPNNIGDVDVLTAATATAAAPVYPEGAQVALSVNLGGKLRTVAGDVITIDDHEAQVIYDPVARKLLERLLFEISSLSERMFS